jgi:hypothetical protein
LRKLPKSSVLARTHQFYVAPPRLPLAQKQQYKPANEGSFGLDTRVDEIIGEYTEGNKVYYFARQDGGIAHKVCPRVL